MRFINYLPFLIAFLFSSALFAQIKVDTIISLDGEITIGPIDEDFLKNPLKERIGQPAKPFDLRDFEGRKHSSEMYAGKIVVIYFWNIWDWDSCEKQTFELNKIAKKYWKDVIVISCVRENMSDEERIFLQDRPVDFTIIPNAAKFSFDYHGGIGTPLAFFIDKKGIWRHIGRYEHDFEPWIKELLK